MNKTGERRKAPSGENIPEGMRKTEAVKLRLPPLAAERLRSFAFEHGWSVSKTVAEALGALERELEAQQAHNDALDEGAGVEDAEATFGAVYSAALRKAEKRV